MYIITSVHVYDFLILQWNTAKTLLLEERPLIVWSVELMHPIAIGISNMELFRQIQYTIMRLMVIWSRYT